MLESIVNLKKALESHELGGQGISYSERKFLVNTGYSPLIQPNDVDKIVCELGDDFGVEFTDNFSHLLVTILNGIKGDEYSFHPGPRSLVVLARRNQRSANEKGFELRYEITFLDDFKEENLKYPLHMMFRYRGQIGLMRGTLRYEFDSTHVVPISDINRSFKDLKALATK